MGSSSRAEWQLERDRITAAVGVLGALCPGSSARVTAGFMFIFCGAVFIRLPEGSGHHLYCRKYPGALGELSTWVMCRSRCKVLVQHCSSGSLPSVPGLPLCLSIVTIGFLSPRAAGDPPRMAESTAAISPCSPLHPSLLKGFQPLLQPEPPSHRKPLIRGCLNLTSRLKFSTYFLITVIC